MLGTLTRLLRHAWLDQSDARRRLSPAAIEQLRRRVAASEQRHSGQVRICIEAGLPASTLWRQLRQRTPIRHVVRERALEIFARLGVWNTEHDNGVLIYLLLAERAIELVADRGIAARVAPGVWDAAVARLGQALHEGRFEDGLTQALEEVSALLVEHFPRAGDNDATPGNELPDEPVFL